METQRHASRALRQGTLSRIAEQAAESVAEGWQRACFCRIIAVGVHSRYRSNEMHGYAFQVWLEEFGSDCPSVFSLISYQFMFTRAGGLPGVWRKAAQHLWDADVQEAGSKKPRFC